MSVEELNIIKKFMDRAVCPEDVFGGLTGTKEEKQHKLTKEFQRLAKVMHEDRYEGDASAKQTAKTMFQSLCDFRDEAKRRVADGTYGHHIPMPGREPIVVKGKYVIESHLCAGDVADLHVAFMESGSRKPLLLKIARNAADNDLLRAEQSALEKLRDKLPQKTWRNAVPEIMDSFLLDQGTDRRRVNVMRQEVGFVSGTEIRRRIPNGLDGRTIAWMWKRLLVLMEWTTKQGYIHGAILPPHVMFYPDNDGAGVDDRKHSIRLVDWCYAVEYKTRTRLSAWVPAWQGLYAPEVLSKGALSPQTDLYMGAKTMLYLAGASMADDGTLSTVNKEVPSRIVKAIIDCTAPDPKDRPQSIGKYFDEFRFVLEREYGKPKWHDFNLPAA